MWKGSYLENWFSETLGDLWCNTLNEMNMKPNFPELNGECPAIMYSILSLPLWMSWWWSQDLKLLCDKITDQLNVQMKNGNFPISRYMQSFPYNNWFTPQRGVHQFRIFSSPMRLPVEPFPPHAQYARGGNNWTIIVHTLWTGSS